MKKIKRILVANRGEIAIRIFRACSELGIRSVAIYSKEDKNSLFRTKADESYLIGKNKGPVEAYLNIDEIINLAIKKGVNAIHPGYGFLSENTEFAKKCEEAGIIFIGPDYKMMSSMGDKIKSKLVASKVGVRTIPGVEKSAKTEKEAKEYADFCGYPVILKASAGGGGRGMRIARDESELIDGYYSAKNEAKKAFGIDDIFVEKYIEKPKHIEVQILGDNYGNIVHLHERDCSIQRRHQKVIEFTPALTITDQQREDMCSDAVKLAQSVNYRSAGTIEFLMDSSGKHYFIEMNPRIQVEHTITEMTTGIDIVQSQILIAEGHKLDSKEVNIQSQESVTTRGYAIQCRVTTEDPLNNFAPDTGTIEMYRTGSGYGVRLDGGNGFMGAIISPYYDSLLVKIISYGRTFDDAIRKAHRALSELKIRGVKTNIPFLINVLNHPEFKAGKCDTGFIESNKELFQISTKEDKELKLLNYIGEKSLKIKSREFMEKFDVPIVPTVEVPDDLRGTKQILDERGADGLVSWIKDTDRLLITDTTMRDAHQSLMATRMRTNDMVKVAKATSVLSKDLFSMEMWGGATFDVAYRFLKESPWERLEALRKRIPNILFQMLLRGANGVGYKNYPDNVIREFIKESASTGIDVFRIFDSLNWLDGLEVALDEVIKTGKVAEVCICYTGDILDTSRDKYTLDYYIKTAKEIEKMGAHILAIKDMSALLKPHAAFKLVDALKQEIDIPIHFHTHDTSGNGVASVLMASEAGVDIVDATYNSMAGLTSQPALNSIVAALENTKCSTGISSKNIQKISDYWAAVKPVYSEFESDLKTGTAEIYRYEIPGGQYSNLKPQVESFGIGHRFEEVKEMYKDVNEMFGDIVKVTPSSKVVGDMAIFMVQNDITPENIYDKGKNMSFPDSVFSYFQGMIGQPMGGFPEELQDLVLKGEEPITCKPGDLLEPEDFDAIKDYLRKEYDMEPTMKDALSYSLYPKVFEEYIQYIEENGSLTRMGSDIFFYGLNQGETGEVEIDEGKMLIIRFVDISGPDDEGYRRLDFEVNDNRRSIRVRDEESQIISQLGIDKNMADPDNMCHIGASIPGTVIKVLVEEGEDIKENQIVVVIEAMKMETNITASASGKIENVLVKEGQEVESGELLIRLEEK